VRFVVISQSLLSSAVAPASVYTLDTSIVVGFVPKRVIMGAVVSILRAFIEPRYEVFQRLSTARKHKCFPLFVSVFTTKLVPVKFVEYISLALHIESLE
jgi:hypothetical protein